MGCALKLAIAASDRRDVGLDSGTRQFRHNRVVVGDEGLRCLDRIGSTRGCSCDGANEIDVVAKSHHQLSKTFEMRHRFFARRVCHERCIGERASDTRIDSLELLDHAVEFSKVSSRGSQRVCGIKSGVENRAGDRRVDCLELLEKIFNLIRRQLRQGHNNLTLDQAELRLQSFDLVSQQFADCAPCRTIPQRRIIELEYELTRDTLKQPGRNAAVLDGPFDVRAEDSPVFSQSASGRHGRPPQILEESSRLRACT